MTDLTGRTPDEPMFVAESEAPAWLLRPGDKLSITATGAVSVTVPTYEPGTVVVDSLDDALSALEALRPGGCHD